MLEETGVIELDVNHSWNGTAALAKNRPNRGEKRRQNQWEISNDEREVTVTRPYLGYGGHGDTPVFALLITRGPFASGQRDASIRLFQLRAFHRNPAA